MEWGKIDSMSHAAKHGDVETVINLVKIVDVNTLNREGCSVLMVAAKWGKTDVVEKLLQNSKMNINLKDKEGNTALFYAVRFSKLDVLKLLLADPNIGVNSINKNKVTSLMVGALKGNRSAVEILLTAADIDINLEDDSEQTALIKAAHQGHEDIVKFFLFRPEIKVNIEDKIEQTALSKAAKQGHGMLVKILLMRLDNTIRNLSTSLLNATDSTGEIIKTALHEVLRTYQAKDSCALDIILMNAVTRGNLKFIELLLNYDEVDENTTDRDGKSLLQIAVECGHVSIVKLLFSYPNIKNSIESKGRTLLEISVKNCNRKMFVALLKTNFIVISPEIELMIYSSLEVAAARGDKDLVRDFLSYPKINMKDCRDYRKYPLLKAIENSPKANIMKSRLEDVARNKYLETVAVLWAAGDYVKSKEAKVKQYLKDSFLYISIVGDADLFQDLIEIGVDINATNDAGYTALMFAVIYKHIQIVRLLCSETAGLKRLISGAKLNINMKNKEGYSALGYAKVKNRPEIEGVLRNSGAKD